jgi:hypothetical protein
VPRYSSPAADARPTIVSISGSPAATSEPKASSRIPSVTGHEITSDFIIALRLAVLKSDHMPDAPVTCTWTPPAESAASWPLMLSAPLTIPLELLAAPAWTIAVCPSRLIETPGEGAITLLTAESALSVRSTFVITDRNAGSLTVFDGE